MRFCLFLVDGTCVEEEVRTRRHHHCFSSLSLYTFVVILFILFLVMRDCFFLVFSVILRRFRPSCYDVAFFSSFFFYLSRASFDVVNPVLSSSSSSERLFAVSPARWIVVNLFLVIFSMFYNFLLHVMIILSIRLCVVRPASPRGFSSCPCSCSVHHYRRYRCFKQCPLVF